MRTSASPLWADVKMITEGASGTARWLYTILVFCNGVPVKSLRMESLLVQRDYIGDYNDVTMLVCWFSEEQVRQYILPNAKTLEVIITRVPLIARFAKQVDSRAGITERYSASLVNVTVPALGENNQQDRDANLTLRRVDLQLINRAMYEQRTQTTGGIFRVTNAGDVIRTQLGAMCKALDLDDSVRPLGIDMVPPDIATERRHIVVPHGTRVVDFANFIQDHCGGVYNNGLGCYYQDRHWYIFPLTDMTRWGDVPSTLNIVKVSPEDMQDVEQSYCLRQQHVYALATGTSISIDPTDHAQLNEGNASRFATASGLMENFASVSQSKAVVDESNVTGAIVADKRATGLNNAKYSPNRITNNVAREASRLSSRSMQTAQFSWVYSDHTLIYPGMPVRVMYNEGKTVKFLQGTVVGTETFIQLADIGMATRSYFAKSAVTVMVGEPPPPTA